jgi:hypothetical protein
VEEQIKVIVESYQKDGIDKKTGQQVYRVYFDFVDIKSYYLFLEQLYNDEKIDNQSVFGAIEYQKIFNLNRDKVSLDDTFFKEKLKWYSGFELIYRNKPLYFRFSFGHYSLNITKMISEIQRSLNTVFFNTSQDGIFENVENSSLIKWFTLDIQELDITEIFRKQ